MAGGLRIGVFGATGALGGEVLGALDASALRIGSILPMATDRSLGGDIEFQGELYPVETGLAELRGLDLLICCAPPEASLSAVRRALRASVPCIDCSGALADSDDVPLCAAALRADAGVEGAPVVATPTGAQLPWALALAPLHREAGVRRVVGSVLEAASVSGRRGIESLSAQSLALFSQRDAPDTGMRPLAFDCLPAVGPMRSDSRSEGEAQLERSLRRLLAAPIGVAASVAQVPAFVGQASALAVETERPLDPKRAEDVLSAAPRIELFARDVDGPSLRAAAGRDAVLVGRVRPDASVGSGLLLWLVADPLRLAAANAVELAAARLRLH